MNKINEMNEMSNNKYRLIAFKRTMYDLSLRDLSEKTNICMSELSKIENGLRQKLSIDKFNKLNSVLHFTKEEIKMLLGDIMLDNQNDDEQSLNEVVKRVLSLNKNNLIRFKNYISFLSNEKINDETKESLNSLIKSLIK